VVGVIESYVEDLARPRGPCWTGRFAGAWSGRWWPVNRSPAPARWCYLHLCL